VLNAASVTKSPVLLEAKFAHKIPLPLVSAFAERDKIAPGCPTSAIEVFDVGIGLIIVCPSLTLVVTSNARTGSFSTETKRRDPPDSSPNLGQ
jgi:hypothetical protein